MRIYHGWLCAAVISAGMASAFGDVTLVGVTKIDGTSLDKSGQPGQMLVNALEGPIPNATFGSAGSGIDYTGSGNIYIMCADRGPNNGESTFLDRIHYVRIDVKPGDMKAEVVESHMLTSKSGGAYTGSAAAFLGNAGFSGSETLRLDPEAVRITKDGAFWLSDEYGPCVLNFDRSGKQIGSFEVPAKYGVKKPSADATRELLDNTMGRQTNRGMEGLAITPSGKLVGLMQSPLIQDHGVDPLGNRIGELARILEMNPATAATAEYVYSMDTNTNGQNEILAINDHQFLVIERDGKAGADARRKNIYKIDITGATDVSKPFLLDGKSFDYSGTTSTNGLPMFDPVPGVRTVTKSPFIDLLSSRFHLAGADFPEKIEGLAWGPNFDNGDKLLIVTSDNDFVTAAPTWFYAFRISSDTVAGGK